MPIGPIATKIILFGLTGGVLGIVLFWSTEHFPNVGLLFLVSTIPGYLWWKIQVIPVWIWFLLYYASIGVGVGWLVACQRTRKSRLVLLVLLSVVLLIVHYLTTFLLAHEVKGMQI